MLDILALAVLIVLVVVGVIAAAIFGALPGMIARKRQHPQADAINVCGWLGLLTLGLLWPLALIWTYTRPVNVALNTGPNATPTGNANDANEIREQITQFRRRLEALERAAPPGKAQEKGTPS